MGWAKFDDRYSWHPKIIDAGPYAELLDMRAIIYSVGAETDGFVSVSALPRIAHGIPTPLSRAGALVEVGRWSTVDGGWQIHDFLEYQPSRDDRLEWRAKGAERQRRSRASRRDRPVTDTGSHGTERASVHATPTPTPTPTNPSGGTNGASRPSSPAHKPTITEQVPRLVAGYVTDYQASHNATAPPSNWKAMAGKAVRMALADGVDADTIDVCLAVIAKESKQPSVLQHVLADYHAEHEL